MTAQMNDIMMYDDREYSISAIKSKNALFNIEKLGLRPVAASTACWRGYIAKLGLDGDNRLLLTDLVVNIEDEEAPAINGIMPDRITIDHNRLKDYDFSIIAGGNTVYNSVDLPLPFTSSMIICDGFIQELYVHMGFHDPYKYEKVIELIFDKGLMSKAEDRSAEAKKQREKAVMDGRMGIDGANLESSIERTFDLYYDSKWTDEPYELG